MPVHESGVCCNFSSVKYCLSGRHTHGIHMVWVVQSADQTLDCHKQRCTGYWWGRELNNVDMLMVQHSCTIRSEHFLGTEYAAVYLVIRS